MSPVFRVGKVAVYAGLYAWCAGRSLVIALYVALSVMSIGPSRTGLIETLILRLRQSKTVISSQKQLSYTRPLPPYHRRLLKPGVVSAFEGQRGAVRNRARPVREALEGAYASLVRLLQRGREDGGLSIGV